MGRIVFMKMVWIYVMLGSMGVFIGSLVPSLFRLDSSGIDWLVIFLWGITVISILTSILGFYRASKLGELEDELKAKEIGLNIEEKEAEKRDRDLNRPIF